MGRDINFLRQMSRQSGLPVVAGGGFYTQPFYPKEIATWSEEQVFQALMKRADTDPIGCWGEIGSWDWITKTSAISAPSAVRERRDQPADLHAHRHSWKIGARTARHLRRCWRRSEEGRDWPRRQPVDANVEVHSRDLPSRRVHRFRPSGAPGDTQQVPDGDQAARRRLRDNIMIASDLSNIAQTKQKGGQDTRVRRPCSCRS